MKLQLTQLWSVLKKAQVLQESASWSGGKAGLSVLYQSPAAETGLVPLLYVVFVPLLEALWIPFKSCQLFLDLTLCKAGFVGCVSVTAVLLPTYARLSRSSQKSSLSWLVTMTKRENSLSSQHGRYCLTQIWPKGGKPHGGKGQIPVPFLQLSNLTPLVVELNGMIQSEQGHRNLAKMGPNRLRPRQAQ